MFLHSLVVSLCLTSYVAPRDQPKFTPIAAETIAEYQKLGAEYGLFEINGRGYVLFRPRTDYEALTEYEATLVPGFKFDSLAAGALDKLPPIAVPFGLAFCDPEMSDSEIGKAEKVQESHGPFPLVRESNRYRLEGACRPRVAFRSTFPRQR